MVISPNKWELDVQGYLNTCNITSATPRKQIRDFAAGVNDLGLWNSMVCWPLRSSQNAGTGTTAFSLGGLGTYNGTLVNGPTWGVDGVSFDDDTTEHISTGLTPALDHCIFAATQCNAEGSQVNVVAGTRPLNSQPTLSGWSLGQSWSGVFRLPIWATPSPFTVDNVGPTAITNGSFVTLYGRLSYSTSTKLTGLTLNAGAEGVSTGVRDPQSLAPLFLGNQNSENVTSLGGALPFFAYFAASSLNNVALRNLYKATLGTGLSLP